jgi:hypothetical protein
MKSYICAKWEDVEDYLETIPGDSSIVIEEMSSLAMHPKYRRTNDAMATATVKENHTKEFWDSLALAKRVTADGNFSRDVYSVQWIPGTEVHKFKLPEDGKYDLYYKFEDGQYADVGTPALQRTETKVSHLT